MIMRLIAKAALGVLALASTATAMVTPASATTVVVGPSAAVVPVVPRDACLRTPEFRPAYCFRHDWRWNRFAFNSDRDWRDRMLRERMRREERQAYLDRRTWEMTH